MNTKMHELLQHKQVEKNWNETKYNTNTHNDGMEKQ